jgi:hypothetical protein
MLHKVINISLSQTHLAVYRKGVTAFGIKIFNNLPSDIKNFTSN